mmetsp:Transcript_4970/g.21471  ORF Transcript_4970/g.21471 Transcript_4970/m.21471 type:complete len:202 (-) Transcript_4970:1019-1624(-)
MKVTLGSTPFFERSSIIALAVSLSLRAGCIKALTTCVIGSTLSSLMSSTNLSAASVSSALQKPAIACAYAIASGFAPAVLSFSNSLSRTSSLLFSTHASATTAIVIVPGLIPLSSICAKMSSISWINPSFAVPFRSVLYVIPSTRTLCVLISSKTIKPPSMSPCRTCASISVLNVIVFGLTFSVSILSNVSTAFSRSSLLQ